MKTITALTHTDDGQPPVPVPNRIIKGKSTAVPFMRQALHTAKGIYVTSTLGGKVFVPWSSLEATEPLLAAPKPVDAPPKTP